ncbi:type VI secretion system TssO [Mucilaginibacter jinjuensis]|uniref:Type VI secretion system TssO n=1 Tax=Mucilaginibacter jinjuensis TaxID=1176721 RepID=A0ABY7T2H3_9SPHI|nr:type VI secretion system TssO [Mucilaginibacter jinjuensis]WCT10473.1 type VI secretion system TssO [Mucilaginibacter jinjuensis]
MKPVNNNELRNAYIRFILYFIVLLACSIVAVYFFFLTSTREVALLNDRAKESDRLVSIRNDINNNFDVILQRMQQLSQYTKMNADELNNQNLLLNDIQESNLKIQAKLQQNPMPLKSFELYKKLSDNISTAANVKDSLFTTRYQIESLRSQLESCNKTNTTAVNKIKGRFGR